VRAIENVVEKFEIRRQLEMQRAALDTDIGIPASLVLRAERAHTTQEPTRGAGVV
jgi:hypothetical protein